MRTELPCRDEYAERQCGGCTVCCTLMQVPELAKPARVRCRYECAMGCAAYDERPETCRDWSCLWYQGKVGLDEDSRPDRLGVMFHTVYHPNGEAILIASEVWPGAAITPTAVALIHELKKRGLTVLLGTDGLAHPSCEEAGRLFEQLCDYRRANPDFWNDE